MDQRKERNNYGWIEEKERNNYGWIRGKKGIIMDGSGERKQ